MGSGFLTSSASPKIHAGDWTAPGRMISDVLKAVEILDTRGMSGPYEVVLSPTRYFQYLQAEGDHGYPAARQLREVVAAVHRSLVVHDVGAGSPCAGGIVRSVGVYRPWAYRLHDRTPCTCSAWRRRRPAATPAAVCTL